MSKQPKLSPTSYALLGLLARGPASAYDLNSAMQTSLIRVFWPRAESHVYSEPKKLLAHGLVSEHREQSGGRARTVYTITDEGRKSLSQWLAQEDSAQHRNQAEFMLKLILADSGTIDNANATVGRALQTSRGEIEEAIAGIEMALEHPELTGPGMPWNGIAINLMADILSARYRWSLYARESTDSLTDDAREDQRNTLGTASYQRALQTLRDVLETPRR